MNYNDDSFMAIRDQLEVGVEDDGTVEITVVVGEFPTAHITREEALELRSLLAKVSPAAARTVDCAKKHIEAINLLNIGDRRTLREYYECLCDVTIRVCTELGIDENAKLTDLPGLVADRINGWVGLVRHKSSAEIAMQEVLNIDRRIIEDYKRKLAEYVQREGGVGDRIRLNCVRCGSAFEVLRPMPDCSMFTAMEHYPGELKDMRLRIEFQDGELLRMQEEVNQLKQELAKRDG